MNHRHTIAIAIACAIVATNAFAGWTRVATAMTMASFRAAATGGVKLEGKTSSLGVKDDGKTLSIVVPLKDVTTGIALRDRHMREKYLEVDKFPEARLDVPRDALKPPAPGTHAGEAKGTFSVHGKSKEVTFKFTGTCKEDGACDIQGEAPINLNDYDIKIPTYLGVTVKPEVTVLATFTLQHT